MVAGAPGLSGTGAVNIYELLGPGSWVFDSSINGVNNGDQFGYDVDFDVNGADLVIGAPTEDENPGDTKGAVYLYQRSGAGPWTLFGNKIYGENAGDRFGQDVSIEWSSNTIAASSIAGDLNYVNIYQKGTGEWDFIDQIQSSENDDFGSSIDLSSTGGRISVGIPGSSVAGVGYGQANVYELGSCRVTDIINVFDADVCQLAFSNQPFSDPVCDGDELTLSVEMDNPAGEVLSYQWEILTDGATDFISIAGANDATYIAEVDELSDGYEYRLKVSSSICGDLYSEEVSINVVPLPIPTIVASSTTYIEGESGVELSLSTSFATYKWYKDGVLLILPDDTATLTDQTAGEYRVAVAYADGCTGEDVIIITETPLILPSPDICDTFNLDIPEEQVLLTDAPFILTGGSVAGGTFEYENNPAAIIDNADGTYSFDPSIAGLGTHQITYGGVATEKEVVQIGDSFRKSG